MHAVVIFNSKTHVVARRDIEDPLYRQPSGILILLQMLDELPDKWILLWGLIKQLVFYRIHRANLYTYRQTSSSCCTCKSCWMRCWFRSRCYDLKACFYSNYSDRKNKSLDIKRSKRSEVVWSDGERLSLHTGSYRLNMDLHNVCRL